MTLESIQEGLEHQITELASFETNQVSINDWSILAGGVDQAVVLEYQGFEADRETYAPKTLFKWEIRVNLLVRYTDEEEGANAIRDRRDDIITRILQNPKLPNSGGTDTALDSLPVSGQISDDERIVIGGVRFLKEWITVEIEELVAA